MHPESDAWITGDPTPEENEAAYGPWEEGCSWYVDVVDHEGNFLGSERCNQHTETDSWAEHVPHSVVVVMDVERWNARRAGR